MLKYLNIRDFALIEKVEVAFKPGLNVLTGETGSGKSLVLSALGLLGGGKASANFVRAGKTSAWVEGAFELSEAENRFLQQLLGESGIEVDPNSDLIIRREISTSGRSRIFINDRLATIGVLRSIKPVVANIQSQGEQLSLVENGVQLAILDLFANAGELKEMVGNSFRQWRDADDLRRSLDEKSKQKAAKEDFLRFQLSEIESVSPQAGEDERLMAERRAASNAEKIRLLTSQSYGELFENDDSALNKLAVIARELGQLGLLDDRVQPWADQFSESVRILEDVGDSLRNYTASFDVTEGRLDEIESRLAELERLKRKHGTDLDGVFKTRDEILNELNSAQLLEFEQDQAATKARQHWAKYLELALQLSQLRKSGAVEFADIVEKHLETVALERSRFEVRISSAAVDVDGNGSDTVILSGESLKAQCTETGIDTVDYYFSANPGEPLKLLSEVASGGELSRLFLVLHTLEKDPDRAEHASGTVVFDEIDVGIGGRVAEAVGRRLQGLAGRQQVLCVTHQPQIARFAQGHFVVFKETVNERTRTLVEEVHDDGRIRELVRMVGGADDVENRRIVDLIFQDRESDSPRKKRRGSREA